MLINDEATTRVSHALRLETGLPRVAALSVGTLGMYLGLVDRCPPTLSQGARRYVQYLPTYLPQYFVLGTGLIG